MRKSHDTERCGGMQVGRNFFCAKRSACVVESIDNRSIDKMPPAGGRDRGPG